VRGSASERRDHREDEHVLAFAWAKVISEAVAQLYDCRYREQKSDRINHFKASFVGRQSNAETASLISQFAVKTVLRLSRQAQRDAGGTSQYATSFAHGCAARIKERAWVMWVDANREEVEAKERANRAERDRRAALRPDPWRLKEGTYEIQTITRTWSTRRALVLKTPEAQEFATKVLRDPPVGVYVLHLKCIAGELKSDEDYFFRVREEKASRGRSLVKDGGGFEAGQKAGDAVGLRVQVSAGSATKAIG